MSYFYHVVISYKGTHYNGWQSLGNEQKTIQDEFKRCLNQISKHQKNNIVACSRTDAGVHAFGQVARIEIPVDLEAAKLMRGLNSMLPNDIQVRSCQKSSSAFHPIADAKIKEYHYYFSDDDFLPVYFHELVTKVPEKLNFKKMQKCAKLFEGEHDFANFHSLAGNSSSTVRTVFSCQLKIVKASPFFTKVYLLKITGDGFLKQMIRYISGAIIGVGKGRISEEEIKKYLKTAQKQKLAAKAAAQGLHLYQIKY
jgi:tRNA pseudouridine38-40 synthase